MEKTQAFQLDEQEVLEKYGLKTKSGLFSQEAKRRLEKDGLNQLTSQKTSRWRLLLRQFHNMIIYILLFAAILTFLMGHTSDAIIIIVVVLVNVFIGYYQEASAADALEKIKNLLSQEATVYRDGIRQDIAAETLVVGDVVFLEAGDNVPADLRMIETDNLRIQESSLTGEADSVEKNSKKISSAKTPLAERRNLAFASTSVTAGSGIGVVIATGVKSEIGKISTEVAQTKSVKTPLMKEIDNLGKGITWVIIGVSLLLFIISLVLETYAISALSLAVVTMIVGSIPEGLPATTSVVLAMGVSDMAKKNNTIVKTLPAVETLGSVAVIATDKTGTLTKNEMTVKDIILNKNKYQVTGDGYAPIGNILTSDGVKAQLDEELRLFLEAGFEANDTVLIQDDGWKINGEPTDGSFLTLYYKQFEFPNQPAYKEIDMLPFDSDYRYIAKLVENKDKQRLLFIKGSPDKLFRMAKSYQKAEFDEEYWTKQVRPLTEQGKRVVAVGYKVVDETVNEITPELLQSGIQFLGLTGIIDPPEEAVIPALKEMNSAGVQVKMITGDHPQTAKAIAEKLNLAPEISVVTGGELDQMSPKELENAVVENQVFARTTPQNKLEIIAALQRNGLTTAMTGDGVNDAPALKKADIGVAMGKKGTDVAKDSADMILTDDNFGTMAIAIREGRRIYDNIKKSILFLLPTSFAEGLIIAFTILLQKDMPLQPTQLLWINMVSAITIQFAFIFEPAEKNIMMKKPRQSTGRIFNRHDIFQMGYVSVLVAAISLIAYEWLLSKGVSTTTASTMMINIVVLSKIFYLFNIRTKAPLFSKSFFTNPKAFIIIGIMLLLQVGLTYLPFMQSWFYTGGLSLLEWLVALIAGILILAITECDKLIRLKAQRQK